MKGPGASEQTLLLEAERVARRDDDMVVEVDVDRLEGVAQPVGHLDVRPRRGGVPGRVRMYHDQGGRAHLERADADLAGIDRRVVDRAGLQQLVANEPILGVELCRYPHNSTYVQPIFMWSNVLKAAFY